MEEKKCRSGTLPRPAMLLGIAGGLTVGFCTGFLLGGVNRPMDGGRLGFSRAEAIRLAPRPPHRRG